jgi:hypothetical protein
MIFLAGGDSFTYGSELKDGVTPFDPNGTAPAQEQVSQSTFTALTAKELAMDYLCVAHPGYSNSSIRRTVMNACEQTKDIGLVFVTWSFPGRYEFRFNFDTGQKTKNWYNITPWSTVDSVDIIKKEFRNDDPTVLQHHTDHLARAKTLGITDFSKIYYEKCGASEYWSAYTSLLDIVLLQQYLQLKNIPYIFSLVDECLLNNSNKYQDENMLTLYRQLNLENWILFPGDRGFYTWARDEGYPIGTTHPLEPAHTDAALHIKEKYHDMVTKSI